MWIKTSTVVVALALAAAAGCSNSPAPTAATFTVTATPTTTPTTKPATPTATAQPQPVAAPSTVYVQQPPTTVYVAPAPAPSTYYAPGTYYAPAPNWGVDGSDWYPINIDSATSRSQDSRINVRVNPSKVSGVVGQLIQGRYVHLVCTQYGDSVTGAWGTTTLWDYIDSPYSGYVSDMWVNTSTAQPVVGSC